MSSYKDDLSLPKNCKEVVKSKLESECFTLGEYEFVCCFIDQLYFLANRSAPRDSANLKVINIDHSYTYDGYNSDFGPYHLEIVHKFCTEIDTLLK